jgi:hypothetical protein
MRICAFTSASILILVGCLFVTITSAQSSDLSAFLDKADLATIQYQRTFRNLVAEELKTYDYFRPDGSIEDSRKIRSIFIIYESPKNRLVAEFRNVVEFNGKNVARSDSSIAKFFQKLAESDSSGEEVQRLKKEGNRFDGKSESYGMTLIGPFVLNRFYRQFFEFQIVGHEKLDGRDVVVVEYKQVKPTLTIRTNATEEELKQEPKGISFDTDLPTGFRPTHPLLQGRMWLDAENGALWRNQFTVTIQPAIFSAPVVSSTFDFEYQASEFGVLLPKKFTAVSYKFSGKSEKDLQKTKSALKTFEYSKFSKPDSEVTVKTSQ